MDQSNCATYFWNSTVTVVCAVILVTAIGAMAACLAVIISAATGSSAS